MRFFKVALLATACFAVLVGSSGCAAIFAPSKHSLDIRSTPTNTEVFVNGTRMGTTPLSLQLKADRTYNVEFRKKGYQPITRVVGSKVGAGWVILDIMSGFVPIVIDAATGAWNVLDESEIDANLEQGQSEK